MRIARERIDGILLLDKTSGLSSNHAMQAARRLFAAAKAGHGGTLDPMAGGLLPLMFGEATKFAADLLDADKTYEAELTLGETSTTADAEGEISRQPGLIPDADAMAVVLRGFVGRIRQLPPMHSALKHAGRPLYEYARAGQVIDREPREVEIKAIEMLGLEGSRLRLRVLCSKGTYIRTLAQDIGAIAGCGAWLSSLRRVAVGELRIAQAVGLDELQSLTPEQRRTTLLPIDALLSSLEQLELDAETAGRFMHGQRIRWRATGTDLEARRVAVRGPGGLLGLAHLDDGLLTPVRLIAQTSLPASPAGVATHV